MAEQHPAQPMSGQIAKHMREQAGLSQSEVAERAQRTEKDVADFEREIADDPDLGLDIFQALRRLGAKTG